MAISSIVLDIEGTVCPISFVKDTLFPYFLDKLESLPQSSNSNIRELLAKFGKEDVVAHIKALVAQDVKDPILKDLQGYVWEEGYRTGEIKAPVYADAIKFIKETKKTVYIYSSGSVKAQKLLFQYVDDGEGGVIDLCPDIAGNFDINTSGRKSETTSYKRIAESINENPGHVLFLSDSILELRAAAAAGFQCKLVVRPGNPVQEQTVRFEEVLNFAGLH
ncbi:LAMI_0D08306g1_1 [Lachancea mirantina]|uniref:LAMI_0D08306g1_1 n=1 Tax=Lachancea mirantina TaxID=1230905 RepID=A0A1G4JCU8_9SACH|nr:LAMI_0D08306g1_1 [Lachancea mirantina]